MKRKIITGSIVVLIETVDDDISIRLNPFIKHKKAQHSGGVFIVERWWNSPTGIWLNLVSEFIVERKIISRSKRIIKEVKTGKQFRLKNIPIESVRVI